MSETKNYILAENASANLLSLQGEQVHEILTYVKSNHKKLDNSIKMFIATFDEDKTKSILDVNNWNEDNKKEVTITNTPKDLDYQDGNGINIIISPTEDLGINDVTGEESQETSSEIYSDQGIRCIKYNYDLENKQLKLIFKRDDTFDYNINIKVLVLYNSSNVYDMPE